MGIAGFYLWLQRTYGQCVDDVPQWVVEAAKEAIEEHKKEVREALKAKGKYFHPGASPSSVREGGGEGGGEGGEEGAAEGEGGKKKKKKKKGKRKREEEDESAGRTPNDNFYVDMNGLIHPCCHDTDPLPEPETEEEMLERCFDQLDLLVRIVRPRKCLFLCIDGVAPRSKMNQQRSRRFRAAEERVESDALAAECADEIVQRYNVPRPRVRERWDSNVITPSTNFMERIAVALKWFVLKKINEDPNWKHLVVVFSDAHVPGEGEHKIMQLVRGMRCSPGYDPDTTHVIHGMDADLICLGLVTHERHVRILRNQLTETYQPDHSRFTYFHLERFREALKLDFACIKNMEFERVIDDFVFLCFFVGNDFLPHVPLISIKTKGIELLLDHYVRHFAHHHYLTKGGVVKFNRLQMFLDSFVRYCTSQLLKEYRGVARGADRAKQNVEDRVGQYETEMNEIAEVVRDLRQEDFEAEDGEGGPSGSPTSPSSPQLLEASDALFSLLTGIRKERLRLVADMHPLSFSYLDKNYRREYYFSKFGWPSAAPDAARANPAAFKADVDRCCGEYLRGMQWVMSYYTSGCPSWEWYYPYHYAPLVEDLAAFPGERVDVRMTLGEPLHPVQQLLAVLPRLSAHALPEALQKAVVDPESTLAKFYPDVLDVDFTEANFSYQGVLRIPFVNCDEMRKECERLIRLQKDEGETLVLFHADHPVLGTLCPQAAEETTRVTLHPAVTRDAAISGQLVPCRPADRHPRGILLSCPDAELVKACSSYSLDIEKNQALCFRYRFVETGSYVQDLIADPKEVEAAERKRKEEMVRQRYTRSGDLKPLKGGRDEPEDYSHHDHKRHRRDDGGRDAGHHRSRTRRGDHHHPPRSSSSSTGGHRTHHTSHDVTSHNDYYYNNNNMYPTATTTNNNNSGNYQQYPLLPGGEDPTGVSGFSAFPPIAPNSYVNPPFNVPVGGESAGGMDGGGVLPFVPGMPFTTGQLQQQQQQQFFSHNNNNNNNNTGMQTYRGENTTTITTTTHSNNYNHSGRTGPSTLQEIAPFSYAMGLTPEMQNTGLLPGSSSSSSNSGTPARGGTSFTPYHQAAASSSYDARLPALGGGGGGQPSVHNNSSTGGAGVLPPPPPGCMRVSPAGDFFQPNSSSNLNYQLPTNNNGYNA